MTVDRKVLSYLVCGLALLLAGCGTTGKFVYPHSSQNLWHIPANPANNCKIAVLPFEDERGSKNQFATYFLGWLPLVPYGWITYERPDAAKTFMSITEYNFTPTEDLAKAAAYSTLRSNICKNAFFSFGNDEADYYLKGIFSSTTYVGKSYTYCISLLSGYLHIFGLPAGSSTNHIDLKLVLVGRDREKIVWQKDYSKEWAVVQGLYYNWGDDCLGFSILFQEIMNDALPRIQQAIAQDSLNSEKIE